MLQVVTGSGHLIGQRERGCAIPAFCTASGLEGSDAAVRPSVGDTLGMSISYFHADGEAFRPSEHAAGPWSPEMLHGRLFGGLAARAIERDYVTGPNRVSRFTVDLFRSASFGHVTVATSLIRDGRRIRVADAFVAVDGVDVAAVRAVVLAETTTPRGYVWQAPVWDSPDPELLPSISQAHAEKQSSDWQIRIHEGGFQSGERARVWTNDGGALVDGEEMTPFVRAAMSADLASPLSNGGDLGVGYINADYTLAMARYPIGAWVGLETNTHLAADGIAVGAATLYDTTGPFATSTTTALANPILTMQPDS